jgi:hypothetical protein
MSQSEARAWWADVQDVRETIERRRAAEEQRTAPRPRLHAVESDVPARRPAEPVLPARRVTEPAGSSPRLAEPLRPFDQESFAEPRRSAHAGGRAHSAVREGAAPARSRRRTVEITGRTVGAPALPRLVEIERRRPAPRAIDRVGARPDKLAMWAVMLGIVLVLVALSSSSHAATPSHAAHAAAAHLAGR